MQLRAGATRHRCRETTLDDRRSRLKPRPSFAQFVAIAAAPSRRPTTRMRVIAMKAKTGARIMSCIDGLSSPVTGRPWDAGSASERTRHQPVPEEAKCCSSRRTLAVVLP